MDSIALCGYDDIKGAADKTQKAKQRSRSQKEEKNGQKQFSLAILI